MTDAERPDLHVDVMGEGKGARTPMLFLHGFGGSARNFRPQMRAFREHRKVIAYDARGHARSGAPAAPDAYDMDALVGDFEHVREEHARGSVVAVGLSLGAAVAFFAAVRRPASVDALVLSAMPSGVSANGWATHFADAIDREGLEAAGAKFVWGGDRFDDAARDFIRRGFLEHDPPALAKMLRGTLAVLPNADDLCRMAEALSVPSLVLVGEHDAPSREISERLAACLPRGQLVVVPGAGHVVNLQAPEAYNQALERFLGEMGT